MTDGATLLSATFAQGSSPQVPFTLPDERCVPTGWLPRCRFKLALRVVSPTRAVNRVSKRGGVFDTTRTAMYITYHAHPQLQRKAAPLPRQAPVQGVCRFWGLMRLTALR